MLCLRMQIVDLIGASGVCMILLAYFLNLIGRLSTKQSLYLWLNFLGGSLACTASILMDYLPFIVLEGFWATVSFGALMKSWLPPARALEQNLSYLLRNMRPQLHTDTFVYAQVDAEVELNISQVVATVREEGGMTLILPKEVAEKEGFSFTYEAAMITLQIHSDLEAVGFTAAFATALGEKGISCNVVAGYDHDHLFVPFDQGEHAMKVLKQLSRT